MHVFYRLIKPFIRPKSIRTAGSVHKAPMELLCAVQQYDWGKLGNDSLVAQIAQNNNSDLKIDATAPYAELWMGAHPSGPSVIKGSNQKLGDWIVEHPECLGSDSQKKFGNQLSFLFKILSIRKALSIQAHPAKEHAEKLHSERPDLYKDPNHKPELAIALTPFEALCGFRPTCKIRQYLCSVPELSAVIGEAASSELLNSDEAGQQVALKKCFQALMTCSKQTVETQLSRLIERLSTLDESSRALQNANLVECLYSQFPGDVGCFSTYLMNVLTLQPGEALYLGPNEPHAYLSGDCIECMACSDNVVRAGLTPKFKDVETLCGMLTYISDPPEKKRFSPQKEDEYTTMFQPPVPDFAVAVISLPGDVKDYCLIPRKTASIIIVIKGDACTTDNVTLCKGTILFVPADQTLSLTTGTSGISLSQALSNA